jgi:hypothetical protein
MGNELFPELVRAVNDRSFNALWGLGVEEGDFACECGRTGCSERLELTVIEYAARDDGQLLLAPGHTQA